MKTPLGIIIYDGISLLNGKDIVVIASGFKNKSENHKLGDMIQTWIICKDINPLEAARTGEDYRICGDCKHREIRSCYVNLAHAPVHVFEAYKRNRYLKLHLETLNFFKNKQLRIGSYGDPAAVPFALWDSFCSTVKSYTGYTHSWRTCDQRLKQHCMASVETEAELFEAQSMGWRTFRVRLEDDSLLSCEFICPASIEGGKKTTCANCNACKGISSNLNKCPCIVLHGPIWKRVFYHRSVNKNLQI